jgi:hypothetical protein
MRDGAGSEVNFVERRWLRFFDPPEQVSRFAIRSVTEGKHNVWRIILIDLD